MTRLSDVNEGISQALEVAQGGKNDRDDCIGVLPCSVEVEKESQANAGSTRRSLSPNTEEVCPDHAQTARQNDSGLCVRQLRKDGQIDVAGVPHSQGLLPGTAAGKDSGVGPLANPQVTAKGIPGYLPSSPNRPAEILEVVDLAGNAPVKDSPLVGNEGVGGNADNVRVSGQHGLCCSADSQLYSLAVFLGGIDALIQQVEGVLLRHRVTETGLAEVGQ